MDNGKEEKVLNAIYLDMLISGTVLSLISAVSGFLLDWDLWMIPVIIAGCAAGWAGYLTGRIPVRSGIFLNAGYFALLVFYFCTKTGTVYDCGLVVMVMLFLFIHTQEKLLIWSGAAVGLFSVIFHILFVSDEEHAGIPGYETLSLLLIFVMIPLGCFLILHVVRTSRSTGKEYIKRIKALTGENERAYSFLANVSHELRTPVNAVIGISDIMRKEALPGPMEERVRAIFEAGCRVSEQIRDIMDYTEIDMGTLVVNRNEYRIGSLIDDLIAELDASENCGLELVIDIDPRIPLTLKGDENKLGRILWHLIRNGYKYTDEGGVYLGIGFVRRDYGINLIIEVRDTGRGMSEEVLENAYEKFFQSESGSTRTAGGIGLGLTIVNGLTESMGGVLSIESREGAGTKAVVSLPQEVVDDTPCISLKGDCTVAGFLGFMTTGNLRVREYYMEMIGRLSDSLALTFHRVLSREELEKLVETVRLTHLFVGTGEYLENREYIDALSAKMQVALIADRGLETTVGGHITVLAKPFSGIQITGFLNRHFGSGDVREEDTVIRFPGISALVVDDEHMNLVVAKEILENYGMQVTTAGSGKEAVALCESSDFDIIFMDHMMPEMDGVEAMHLCRQAAAKKNMEINIVALTANATSMAKDMFLREGFDGFVSKPVGTGELEKVLRSVLPKSAAVHVNKASAKQEEDPDDRVLEFGERMPDPKKPDDKGERTLEEVLKELGVDTDYGLQRYGNDRDFYRELLADYAAGGEMVRTDLAEAFGKKDWNAYMIRAHGLKSTSALIGAEKISSTAGKLEQAAKEENGEIIAAYHTKFLNEYGKIVETINAYEKRNP
ncbi:MAG: response regulator [Lachnospiraceae bacterium]|nr:response regulator [Lachnospiraceae bacterium]